MMTNVHNENATYQPAAGYPQGAELLAAPQQGAQAAPGGPPAGEQHPHQPQAPQRPPAPASVCTWGNLPAAMRERCAWLLAGPNDKGEFKVPVSVDTAGNRYAGSSTNPLTWLTFDVARAAANHYGCGIGYVLSKEDPFVCVDFDVKNATNAPHSPEKWTSEEDRRRMQMLVEDLDSYTELSQSGQGVHVWALGKLKGDGIKKDGVEVYDTERFIACTGRSIHAPPLPIEKRGDDIAALEDAMRGAQAAMNAHMALILGERPGVPPCLPEIGA